ncbi:hypothetical protein AA313_de0203699 [Arthrobotrys entomopaga]|nr:hypothetical protein AA313_de0203699 [Arthrobotrys entomopaga]
MSLATTPVEIAEVIAANLRKCDIVQLLYCSRRLHALYVRSLYSSVEIGLKPRDKVAIMRCNQESLSFIRKLRIVDCKQLECSYEDFYRFLRGIAASANLKMLEWQAGNGDYPSDILMNMLGSHPNLAVLYLDIMYRPLRSSLLNNPGLLQLTKLTTLGLRLLGGTNNEDYEGSKEYAMTVCFLESLNPGLESIILAIDDLDSGIMEDVREITSLIDSFFILETNALLKHSATLRGFAIYICHKPFRIFEDEINGDEDNLLFGRMITTGTYRQQFRQLLLDCPHLQELSVVVPMGCSWAEGSYYKMKFLETEDFRGLPLDGIKFIHIVPAQLGRALRMWALKATPLTYNSMRLTAEFLEAIYEDWTVRPPLEYVAFGLPSTWIKAEFIVEWKTFKSPAMIAMEGHYMARVDTCEDDVEDEECVRGGYDPQFSFSLEYGDRDEATYYWGDLYEGWRDEAQLVRRHRLGIERKRRKDKTFVKWYPHLTPTLFTETQFKIYRTML